MPWGVPRKAYEGGAGGKRARCAGHACVIYENIELAPLGDGTLHGVYALLLVGDVEVDDKGFAAERLNLFCHLCAVAGRQIGDGDISALPRHDERDATADTLACASDEGG